MKLVLVNLESLMNTTGINILKPLKFLFIRRFFSKVAINADEIVNYLKNTIK
jgi:hypothetical protein